MYRPKNDDDLDSEEIGNVQKLRNIPRVKQHSKPRVPRNARENALLISDVIEQEDQSLKMTYQAARYEAVWLKESLEYFYQNQWFDDVLRMIKGGKEASVYLCRGNKSTGVDLMAAKVYRPRQFRNLKNDWMYREGRGNLDESGNRITNRGMLHAMSKKTEYGRELMHTSWLEHELQALHSLHAAGADVPKPFASGANAILMQYYGDEIMGAPTLNEVSLPPAEARQLFDRVLHNIHLMLSQGRIHGDLSAYNILYWEGEIALIDFPQVVRPAENRNAYRIFERDVIRICEYFTRQGVQLAERGDPRRLAAEIWRSYNNPQILPVDPKVLSEDRDDERDIWESLRNA